MPLLLLYFTREIRINRTSLGRLNSLTRALLNQLLKIRTNKVLNRMNRRTLNMNLARLNNMISLTSTILRNLNGLLIKRAENTIRSRQRISNITSNLSRKLLSIQVTHMRTITNTGTGDRKNTTNTLSRLLNLNEVNMKTLTLGHKAIILLTTGLTGLNLSKRTRNTTDINSKLNRNSIILRKLIQAIGRSENMTHTRDLRTTIVTVTIVRIRDSKRKDTLNNDLSRTMRMIRADNLSDTQNNLRSSKKLNLLNDNRGNRGGLRILSIRDTGDMITNLDILRRLFNNGGYRRHLLLSLTHV